MVTIDNILTMSHVLSPYTHGRLVWEIISVTGVILFQARFSITLFSTITTHLFSYNMKDIIKTLIHNPEQFSPNDATIAINAIMQGSATHSQVSAFLIALRLQQKDQDPAIVAACAQAMQSHARLIPYNHYEHLEGNVVDIVGTGGDGHDTYNVSTTASIVAAGAGAKVAKVCPIQRLYQQSSFNNTYSDL